jgi:hypothetical protein
VEIPIEGHRGRDHPCVEGCGSSSFRGADMGILLELWTNGYQEWTVIASIVV